MSLSSSNDSIIGGNFDEKVRNQLKARQSIFSERENRNTKEIQYLNGGIGWIRISSSVNTQGLNSDTTTSNLAEQNVLLGGTISSDGTIREGLFGSNSSYDKSILGERPMAGITGFTVASRGFAGALKMATVELTMNSIEQLSTLEQLYMRPGFTVFVEYGHSIYVTNKHKISSDARYLNSYFEEKDRSEIIRKAKVLKDNSDNNYDFMYGYVTNFNWQSNNNGGYDCRFDIVSAGDLIESLSVAISGGTKNSNTDITSKSLRESTTALHRILYFINNADTEKYFKDETIEDDAPQDVRNSTIEEVLERECSPLWPAVKAGLEKNNHKFSVIRTGVNNTNGLDTWLRYISLGTLLELINNIFIPTNDNDKPVFKFNISSENSKKATFTTFKRHFCIDPMVAVLPKSNSNKIETNFKVDFANQESFKGDENDILNIHISTYFILELLDTILDTDKISNQSLYDFISNILNKLTDTLGNINDFDIHSDEDNDELYIIDRTVLPNVEQMRDTRSQLDIFKLGSTVQDYSFTSTIPSSMTAVSAAAASAQSSDVRNQLHSMFRWNTGLVDRTNISTKYDGVLDDKKDTVKTELIALARYLKNLNKSSFSINLDQAEIIAAKPVHRKIMSIFREFETNGGGQKGNTGTNASGLIPIRLDLTMKGISGIKIGQCFTVNNEILPVKYRNRVAFQVMSLTNTVVSNKWLTEISTLMFSLDVPENKNKEITYIPQITVEDLEREFTEAVRVIEVEPPEIEFTKPLGTLTERNDSKGLGKFGKKLRDGGTRDHTGWDVEASPGSVVKSPIEGQLFKNNGFGAYGHPVIGILGTGKYTGLTVLLGYCDWISVPKLGAYSVEGGRTYVKLPTAKPGDSIAMVTDLTKPYGSKPGAYPKEMVNHIHIKVTYNGELVDPSKLNWK